MATHDAKKPSAAARGSNCANTRTARRSRRGQSNSPASGVTSIRSRSARHCRSEKLAAATANSTGTGSNTPRSGITTSRSFANRGMVPARPTSATAATKAPNRNDCEITSQVARCPIRLSSCWILEAIMLSLAIRVFSLNDRSPCALRITLRLSTTNTRVLRK